MANNGNNAGVKSTRIAVPQFSSEQFKVYMEEVELWREVCDVPKVKQGIMLWLQLPRDHPSDIKELIMAQIGMDTLKSEDGIDRFMEAMNEAFKPSDEMRDIEVYRDFYKKMERKEGEKINDFVNRFDKCANIAKRHEMDLPPKVKGLKLLDDAGISDQDVKLVLTEVDFTKKDEVYKQAKKGLAKYMREGSQTKDSAAIKMEVLSAADEEALIARGWTRPNGGRGGGSMSNWRKPKSGGGGRGGQKAPLQKKENPRDDKGEILRCLSCDSIRHLLPDCPDSWENLTKFRSLALAAAAVQGTENESGEAEEDVFFTRDMESSLLRMRRDNRGVEDVILYSNNKKRIIGLGGETLGCLLLDCGCSCNVMGETWWRSYFASLSEEMKKKVRTEDGGGRKFRFGGDEVLTASKLIRLPARVAGRDIMFECHVVKSGIPLLWSRPSMAKAGVVLDLPQDRAKIFDTWIDLDLTSVGHYALRILPTEESVNLSLPSDVTEKEKLLRKIHRQFGHPMKETEITLLKNIKCDDAESRKLVSMIHDKCDTCKIFSPTPARPVVSLCPASEFQEVLTLDLKEVKVGPYNYILHMIDAFTRFTCSVFMSDKRAETVIHHVMKNWVANYGRMKKIWSDVGGEFNNNAVRELGEAIGCKVETGAGYSAWMNGINERNHAVVDRCLAKIMYENPEMDPEIALAWAVTAKNSYPMFGGFSSFQLVFGKQPNLPNILSDKLPALEGVTTSQSVAAHITAMYAGRKAFTEAMYDSKVRKALRHRVRAVEKRYENGEQVFYRRDGGRKEWKGPATVIGNKGSVHYLVHQGEVIRVAACRMVSTGDAEKQMGESERSVKDDKKLEAVDKEEERSVVEVYEKVENDDSNPQMELVPEIEIVPENNEDDGNPQMEVVPEIELVPENNEDSHGDDRHTQAEMVRDTGREEEEHESVPQLSEGRSNSEEPPVDRRIARILEGNRSLNEPKYPKAGDVIQMKEGGRWRAAVVIGRGAKASSKKYGDYFNVRIDGQEPAGVYLDKVIWKRGGEEAEDQVNVVIVPSREHGRPECMEAKNKELDAFKRFEVYEEVDDIGQERLSSRWVLTDKSTETESRIKARLVCRGFEEEVKIQSDSPTGGKETLHILLAIAASKEWRIKSGDVKNAYLQGTMLEREVYMEPPAERNRCGKIWRLKKAVYGMNDAGRRWFLKVESALLRLGCEKSKYDHCLFVFRVNGSLAGIILLWVDDIFYAGILEFEEKVMEQIAKEFMIGRTEEETFQYVGLNISTIQDGITLDQINYIEERTGPAVLRGGDNKRPLDREESKLLRQQTGKINWAATQSRPDLSYSVVELSMKFKNGTLADLKKTNKAMMKLAARPTKILFPKLTGDLSIITYSDAAFQNLPDKISSGRGHVVFLAGAGGRAAPLGWSSNKIRRVVSSTSAAEALSLQSSLSHAIFLRALLTETLGVEDSKIPIRSYIDSNDLFQAIKSTKFVEDKRQRLDIALIKQDVEEQAVEVRWVETGDMLADPLTKNTVKADQLMTVLESGRLPVGVTEIQREKVIKK